MRPNVYLSGQGNEAFLRRDGEHGGADDAYLYRGGYPRNAATAATKGARILVPRGMITGFAPGSTVLSAIQMCPIGSRLAFGKPRLKPNLVHLAYKCTKWLRGFAPVTNCDPTQLVLAHLSSAR